MPLACDGFQTFRQDQQYPVRCLCPVGTVNVTESVDVGHDDADIC